MALPWLWLIVENRPAQGTSIEYCAPKNTMDLTFRSLFFRFVSCVGVTVLVWFFHAGVLGFMGYDEDSWVIMAMTALTAAPAWAIAFARPLLDAITSTRGLAKLAKYHDVHGNYHAFKGQGVLVQDDSDGHPWLCARDLRTVLGHLPTDGVLLRLFGENAELRTRSKTLWLKVEALEPYLARSTSKNSIDFKKWLQKTVLLPSRRRRGEPIAQIAQDVGATSDRG